MSTFDLLSIVFIGAAALAALMLYARQALLLAYLSLGLVLGPYGLSLLDDVPQVAEVSEIGIAFLLFLLGLNLEPGDLKRMFSEAVVVTVLSCLCFAVLGAAVALAFGFSWTEVLLIGIAQMFSSTIIGIKLLPTTALHHQRMGNVIVSILLLQDMIAIIVFAFLGGPVAGELLPPSAAIAVKLMSVPLLIAAAWFGARYALMPLVEKFELVREFIFLLAIGWCLLWAQVASLAGIPHEVGAFIAGVSLAVHPVSRYLAEALRPLRDFFLILFFVTIGASLKLHLLMDVALPAVLLAGVALFIKPWVFRFLLERFREEIDLSQQIGVRLGQISEFSLLLALLALHNGLVSESASTLIESAAIITFAVSSFWIVRRYPTPIATSNHLRAD